jgi:hypothetical protein
VCSAALCVPASCTDSQLNGDETDVDCGGSCPPCVDTKECQVAADCQSGVCAAGVCKPCGADGDCPAVAFCDEQASNGGSCTPDLGLGVTCTRAAQCQSGFCVDGACCDGACDKLCEACSATKTGGQWGHCAPVTAGIDPDNECTLAAKTCAGDFCSGQSGACGPAPKATECRPKTGPCDFAESCDGSTKACPQDLGAATATDPLGDCGFAKLCDSAHQCASMHQQSQRFGSQSFDDYPTALASQADGKVVIAGYFSGTIGLGGGPITAAGGSDGFLAKYDQAGKHLWSKALGGFNWDNVYAAVLDTTGSVLVAGSFWSTTDFGGGTIGGAGNYDSVLAKYDQNGKHLWSMAFGGNQADGFRAVATDASANVIAAGYFAGTADFGCGALVSAGQQDIVLAKYDQGGKCLWSKRLGDVNWEYAPAVAVDAAGNIVLAAYFWGSIDFGGGALVSAGSSDVAVARYDKDGVHLWSRRLGGAGNDIGSAAAFDATSNVLLAGSFEQTADFGGGLLTSAGGADAVVAKYDPAGKHLWSKRFGAGGADAFVAVADGGSGSTAVLGSFEQSVDFGGGALSSVGFHDIVLARYGL